MGAFKNQNADQETTKKRVILLIGQFQSTQEYGKKWNTLQKSSRKEGSGIGTDVTCTHCKHKHNQGIIAQHETKTQKTNWNTLR